MKTVKIIQKLSLHLILLALLWTMAPATFEAQANGEGTETTVNTGLVLNIVPQQLEVYPGSTVQVNLLVEGATDLYGLQANCQVDPTILAWQTAEFSGFFTDAITGANSYDLATGTWLAAISQKNPAPALNGNGVFATLTFQVLAPGTVTVVCEPLAANRDGFEVPMTVNSTPIIVNEGPLGALGTLLGSILYQGRTDHSGMQVAVEGASPVVVISEAGGQFEAADLENGEYNVTVDAALYLPTCASLTIVASEVTTLEGTLLYGGDTDDDNEIRINDATLLGSNFGLTASTTPAMNPRADINADGQVNVQDLSILGGNFGKSGCQPWIPAAPLTDTQSTVTSS